MSCAAFSFELEYKVEDSDSKTAQNDDHSLDTEEDLCDKTADHQQNVKCAAGVDYISGEVPYHVKDDCCNAGTHNLQRSRDDLVAAELYIKIGDDRNDNHWRKGGAQNRNQRTRDAAKSLRKET